MINIITTLLIISALVKTNSSGKEFSTNYLLPTDPNIPPRLNVILVSTSLFSIKKTKHKNYLFSNSIDCRQFSGFSSPM